METLYLFVVIFLLLLAVMGLCAGVSNDAVNFLSSAVGTRAASTKWILIIASAGVLCGASINNGMMDIARNGVFHPEFFYAPEVMCIFMSVMVANLILLDMFNMIGMPTSTTVSMVFELLGGTVAIALIKSISGDTTVNFAALINTDKAFSMILGIFLSVAIAFIFGSLVQYIARLIFTFNYKRNLSWKIGLFGGVATTALVYFMLIKGLGGSSLMSAETKVWLDGNTWTVIWMCFVVSTVIMQVLHWLKVNVFKVIVMMGTFALAMAFAGNDLVNFIGVPIAGYDTYVDFMANSGGDIENYLMTSLNESYPTPFFFLLTAGLIMVITLATSKKAKIVLKTSLDLSRQDTGDEMFGSSAMARGMVRGATQMATAIDKWMPDGLKRWINSRFNYNESIMEDKAAFDLVRGSVNLVLAGMLIALGTSLQLPLSTTFVAFMVGMGSSLADRAWGRDSAVYRVTGVFSVIGGWLFTAVAAFLLAFIIAIILHFGGIVAMILVLALAIFLVVRNSFKAKKKTEPENPAYNEMMTTNDNDRRLHLLLEHNRNSVLDILDYSNNAYNKVIDGFLKEDVRLLKKSITGAAEAKSRMKIMKRKEIMVMRMLDPMVMMKKNTWFHLSYNCCEQMLYSIRRICDPCKEHVDNSFTPLDGKYRDEILYIKNLVAEAADITRNAITSSDYSNIEPVRDKIKAIKDIILGIRRQQMDRISQNDDNIDVSTLYLSIIQESEELITEMRHLVRDISKLSE